MTLKQKGRLPFALPSAPRHIGEGRIHAVDVVGNVTVVTEQKPRLIVALAAALTHGTVQASPAPLQDHFGNLHMTY